MFDRCDHERATPPTEGARTLTSIDGSRVVTIDGAGEVYLGRLDGAPLYVSEGTTFNFREAAAVLSADDVGLLSYAQGMLNWMQRTKYCSVCAAPLEPRRGGHMRACTQCGAEVYPRTDPAVMMLVTHGGRLLLAQHKGRASVFWSTLAGFVEPGESLEGAARRELFEETGLVATELRYFGSQSWPLPASLMIGFLIEVENDVLTLDESEIADARFFTREELDGLTLSNPISLSRWMIEAWRGSFPD
jgi:NAD+ diphosphatase